MLSEVTFGLYGSLHIYFYARDLCKAAYSRKVEYCLLSKKGESLEEYMELYSQTKRFKTGLRSSGL